MLPAARQLRRPPLSIPASQRLLKPTDGLKERIRRQNRWFDALYNRRLQGMLRECG